MHKACAGDFRGSSEMDEKQAPNYTRGKGGRVE